MYWTVETNSWNSFWNQNSKLDQLIIWLLMYIREKLWVKHFTKVILNHSRRGKVLEAGSGSALGSILLSQYRGDSVCAVDYSSEALSIAQTKAKEYKVSLKCIKNDIRALAFKASSFDIAWNGGTLEHFDDPIAIVKEMKRVSSKVITIVPARGLVFSLFVFGAKFLGRKKKFLVHGDEFFYNRKELQSIFYKAGFENITIQTIRCLGIFPYHAVIAN